MVPATVDTSEYTSLAEKVEEIYTKVVELFNTESSAEGLFSYRSANLQQFGLLSSSYHQANSIEFLDSSSAVSPRFGDEINIANYRTKEYQDRAISAVKKNLKTLKQYYQQMVELGETIADIGDKTNHMAQDLEHSYYANILESLQFYLSEINSRIVIPAANIIALENEATDKLLLLLEERYHGKIDISSEEVARLCEMLSWGLESPPGWKSIQSDASELSGDLEKKIGSLKALASVNFKSF